MATLKEDLLKFIYYEDDGLLVGWLEEYPDYRTQGETLEELKVNLKDIYEDIKFTLTSIDNTQSRFKIPLNEAVRK